MQPAPETASYKISVSARKPVDAIHGCHVVTPIMTGASLLLPGCWTAIAERPRECEVGEMLHWHGLAGAPLYPSEARDLAAKGAIVMTQRFFPDRVELLCARR
jgi:hypothetical protein